MIITFCNGKGGVGKSTISVLFTLLLQHANVRVGHIDRDPQGTSTYWLRHLGRELAHPNEIYDYNIIDTPPLLNSPMFTESISQANRIIVVCSPSPTDIWTTKDTVSVVKKFKKTESDIFLLFNRVKKNTTLSNGIDSLAKQIDVPKIPGYISDRQSFQHASLYGIDGLNTEALSELTKISQEIFT